MEYQTIRRGRCVTHPRYKGARIPRVLCEGCWRVFIVMENGREWRHWAKTRLADYKKSLRWPAKKKTIEQRSVENNAHIRRSYQDCQENRS